MANKTLVEYAETTVRLQVEKHTKVLVINLQLELLFSDRSCAVDNAEIDQSDMEAVRIINYQPYFVCSGNMATSAWESVL